MALVATLVLAVPACDGGGDGAAGADKVVRNGATASVADGLVWVAGGAEGPRSELAFGDPFGPGGSWRARTEVVAYDLDGAEVSRVEAVLDDDLTLVDAVVTAVDGELLLVGGACPFFGFGCNGATRSVVAWLDVDAGSTRPVPIGSDVADGGSAQLLGVAGGAAWVFVDPRTELRLLRVDAATGEASAVALPPFAWTGHACVGSDGLVAVVADLDDRFVASAVELWRRPAVVEGDWAPTGVLRLDDHAPGTLRLHCIGGGRVLLDLSDRGSGPLVVAVDGAVVGEPAPPPLHVSQVAVAVDAAGTGAVVAPSESGHSAPAFLYRPARGWTELGRLAVSFGARPILAVVDGVAVDVGGMAVVEGVGARRVGVVAA